MKKYFSGVLTGFIVCTMFASTFAIANSPIKLIVNGKLVESDVPPQIINGRTMIPARPLAEALGAKVMWDEEIYAVVVTGGVQVGVVPTDLDAANTTINQKSSIENNTEGNIPPGFSPCGGFTINGESFEKTNPFDSNGFHTMGHVTSDNFYLEENALNYILSNIGLPTVQHKCPSPDVKIDEWYFISLKDVSTIDFSFDFEEFNLSIWDKSKSRPISEKERVEEFIPNEWVSEYDLENYGVIAKRDDKIESFMIQNKDSRLYTPYSILEATANKSFSRRAFGEYIRLRMIDGIIYVNKHDIETTDFFKNVITKLTDKEEV